MASESDLFSIVVAGAMNPGIHHPMWYRLVGLFNEEESEEAIQSKNTFCTPPIAQIELKRFKIICVERRWEAQTQVADLVDRLRMLAASVFDDILKHTPVSAFGFNCSFVRETSCNDVGIVIATSMVHADLGLITDNLSGGDLVLRRKLPDDHLMTTSMRAGSPPSIIAVDCNFHYSLESETPGFITLRNKLDLRIPTDQREASDQMQRIVAALNGKGKA